MAARAGVVWVDVEPDLRGVGSKIESGTRGIRPVGLKVDLDDRQLGRATSRAQASVDSLNTRKAQAEFQTLGGTASRALDDIQSDIRGIQSQGGLSGGQLVAVGGAATVAGARIVGALRPAVAAASDLNETLDFSRQVFGSGADEIEKWADGAARSIGASKREALDAATTFATYGKQIGLSGDELVAFATKWTQAAADFASARNTTFEQAQGAIASAFRGENDPIEGYSILLNEATLKQAALAEGIISTSTEALTPQQRILAASSEIWRQSADLQGNFAKTADGLANSTKTANAELENTKAAAGSGLTAALASAEKAATGLFDAIDKIPGGAEAIGIAGAAIGGASILGGAATSILGARRAIRDYRAETIEAVDAMATAGDVGERSFTKIGGAAKAAQFAVKGLALLAAADAGVSVAQAIRGQSVDVEDSTNALVAALQRGAEDSFTALARFDDLALTKEDADGLFGIPKKLIENIGTEFSLGGVTATRDIEEFQAAWEELKGSLTTEQLTSFLDAVEGQNNTLPKTSTAYKETKKLLDEWRRSVNLAADAQETQTSTTKLGGDALDQFGFKIDATKTKAEQYADSLAAAFDPLQGALDAQSGLADAQERVADAEAKVNELRNGSAEASRKAADAARELADAERSVEQAKRSQAAAYRDLADANRDLADLEAELVRVNPLTDPNRYRELSEKVRDARDAQLDAQDRVANAAEGVRDAEQQVADKRAEQTTATDELRDAEKELADARRAEIEAAQKADAANRLLREEFEKHPEAISASFGVIDEWVAKGMIGAETARVWKEQLLLLIAAQDTLAGGTPNPGAPPTRDPDSRLGAGRGPSGPATPATTSTGGRSRAAATTPMWNPAAGGQPVPGSGWVQIGAQTYQDPNGFVWRWDGRAWVQVQVAGGRRTGGPVQSRSLYRVVEDDQPELLTLGGDTFLMTGAQAGLVTPLGGNATAAPAEAPALVGAPAGAATAVLDASPIVAELQALRSVVTNLQNVTYSPQITTVPGQVEPTMAEALRASRRDGWENHGRWLPNG